MSNIDIRWQQRLKNYAKAFNQSCFEAFLTKMQRLTENE